MRTHSVGCFSGLGVLSGNRLCVCSLKVHLYSLSCRLCGGLFLILFRYTPMEADYLDVTVLMGFITPLSYNFSTPCPFNVRQALTPRRFPRLFAQNGIGFQEYFLAGEKQRHDRSETLFKASIPSAKKEVSSSLCGFKDRGITVCGHSNRAGVRKSIVF